MASGNAVKENGDSWPAESQHSAVTPSLQINEVQHAVPTGSLQSPSQRAPKTEKIHMCPFQALADKGWLTLNVHTKPGAYNSFFTECETVYYFAPKLHASYFTHTANPSTKAGKKGSVYS